MRYLFLSAFAFGLLASSAAWADWLRTPIISALHPATLAHGARIEVMVDYSLYDQFGANVVVQPMMARRPARGAQVIRSGTVGGQDRHARPAFTFRKDAEIDAVRVQIVSKRNGSVLAWKIIPARLRFVADPLQPTAPPASQAPKSRGKINPDGSISQILPDGTSRRRHVSGLTCFGPPGDEQDCSMAIPAQIARPAQAPNGNAAWMEWLQQWLANQNDNLLNDIEKLTGSSEAVTNYIAYEESRNPTIYRQFEMRREYIGLLVATVSQ